MAINAALEEAAGYLRSRYDCQTIFNQIGNNRNSLLVELCKDMALWYIIRLSNVDMIYTNVKERYDRAVEWFDKVAKGIISPELPVSTDENGSEQYPIRYGTMDKQQYDY